MDTIVNGNNVPVVAGPGISEDQLTCVVTSKKFVDYAASFSPAVVVSKIEILSVKMFGKNVGFIMVDATVTKDGKFIPGTTFIRGDSVAMLVVLDCEGELYSPLTVQPRVSVGAAEFEETAAGMLDDASFLGAAAKEIDEELGFTIPVAELVDLREAATGQSGSIALSPGGCDEEMMFFLYRRSVTRAELGELQGKLTGVLHEGETITLKVVPLDDVWAVGDGKTIIAMGFYDRAVRRGTI